ncbi:hypothetical protein TNIN_44281 [Trichonephila inaurata madagascariensis]|uniref:Major facilitator superfamily associated domain-containing protein n=1 Tax=Trichonephila inaurata madagascariensis TaxID=2747483 RepID=A0A8X6X1L8_9ARAC|nr:hypothetical protein TNIN_44281 [Trichonephila inaurata madagascariensis]
MPEERNGNGFQYPEKFESDTKNKKSNSVDISICKGCKLSVNKTFLPVKAALFCWFAALSALFLWQVETKVYKPSAKLWRKALVLGKKLEIWFFVPLLLIMGSCFGSVPSIAAGTCRASELVIFLSVLLEERYAIYGISFSFLELPWPAVVIELSSILAYHLHWIAVMQYAVHVAPEGLEATVKVLAGSIQYNLGKIITTSIGGYVMTEYGGRVAFRTLGIMASIYAAIYGSYLFVDHLRKKKLTQSESNHFQAIS